MIKTICLNCGKVHETPQQYTEHLAIVTYCPDCPGHDMRASDYEETLYRVYIPKEKDREKPYKTIKEMTIRCDHNWKQWEDEWCNAQLRCTKCKQIYKQ